MTEQITLYPLHDTEFPSVYIDDYRYVMHKEGEDRVTIVCGYWRTGTAIRLDGVATIDRLIDALRAVKVEIAATQDEGE